MSVELEVTDHQDGHLLPARLRAVELAQDPEGTGETNRMRSQSTMRSMRTWRASNKVTESWLPRAPPVLVYQHVLSIPFGSSCSAGTVTLYLWLMSPCDSSRQYLVLSTRTEQVVCVVGCRCEELGRLSDKPTRW